MPGKIITKQTYSGTFEECALDKPANKKSQTFSRNKKNTVKIRRNKKKIVNA